MYKKMKLEGVAKIEPNELGNPLEEAVDRALRNKYEAVVDKTLGTIVAVLGADEIGEGHILAGDGAIYYHVNFDAIVFKPEMQEIIEGAIGGMDLTNTVEGRERYGVREGFVFDRQLMTKLLRFGSPSGAEFFLNLLGFNLLVMTFHSYGVVAATAMTITFNWDLVSFIPLVGVGIAVTSLVGRYIGAGKPDLAHRATMSGVKLAASVSTNNLTLRDRYEFIAFAFERYYRIVTPIVRKYDPHHLYLGSRINYRAGEFDNPYFWKAIAPYHDVVSVNYYNNWGPQADQFAAWEKWADRPVLLTEWYAKAMDVPGLANRLGAGFLGVIRNAERPFSLRAVAGNDAPIGRARIHVISPGWQERDEQAGGVYEGKLLRRTMSMAHLGGATLDNEENYLLKKLFSALGIVQVENQARI